MCDSLDILSIEWVAMDKQIRQRLVWVEMYSECGDAGLVCRRCGISRPTLRKWATRYGAQGIEGLRDQSRRPNNSPNTKIGKQEEQWILSLRSKRKLGARRLQNELFRHHECSLSLASIHKMLVRNDVKPFKKRKMKSEYIRTKDRCREIAFRWILVRSLQELFNTPPLMTALDIEY